MQSFKRKAFFICGGKYSWARVIALGAVVCLGGFGLPQQGLAQPIPGASSQLAGRTDKHIVVSLKEQTLAYYQDNQLLGSMKISSGAPGHATPRGTFRIDKKLPSHNYTGKGYNYPDTKWNLRFKWSPRGSYYIHGAYWHNNFGRPVSHGCINVSYADLESLYAWTDLATVVRIE